MTPEKLFSRHPLDNGLILEFWDLSRPMAGDRWLVVLELRLAIPVGSATLPADLLEREADISRALGPEVVFSQRHERVFIAADEYQAILTEIEARLFTLAPSYLGHPEFPGRFIRKRFTEAQEKERWQHQQNQH
jgi:hypothetical protein